MQAIPGTAPGQGAACRPAALATGDATLEAARAAALPAVLAVAEAPAGTAALGEPAARPGARALATEASATAPSNVAGAELNRTKFEEESRENATRSTLVKGSEKSTDRRRLRRHRPGGRAQQHQQRGINKVHVDRALGVVADQHPALKRDPALLRAVSRRLDETVRQQCATGTGAVLSGVLLSAGCLKPEIESSG